MRKVNRVSIKDLFADGGGVLLLAMTLLQIAPIKINPWTALAKWIGRQINGDMMKQLEETRRTLDHHIIDGHRARILAFNSELLRGVPHTEEEYVDVLNSIDEYERYCQTHPDYKNSRAVHAIANISRLYDERLAKNDFL